MLDLHMQDGGYIMYLYVYVVTFRPTLFLYNFLD